MSFRGFVQIATLCLVVQACSSRSDIAGGEGAPPNSSKGFKLKETLEPVAGLKIHSYLHKKSGLEVFLVPKPGTGIVAYTTAYDVGSRFEVKGRTGLAHLFEHMMFRGTGSYPE